MARNPNSIMGIVHTLPCNEPIEIIALGDLHIGDANCNMKLVQSMIDSVLNTPNRYAILTGDLLNTAIVGSKSDSYSETMKPQDQLDTAVDLLKPIADKILAIVPGNHEERISRSVGVDMTHVLATSLDLENCYRSTSALLFVKIDKQCYSIYINHGHGGGRRPGGKINGLSDFAQIIDTDCYVIGHTHLPATFKQQTYRVSAQRGVATLREQLFVNTASALHYGGYGDRNGYVPGSNSYPVIILDNTEHKLNVIL